jgi:autotransporter-associated beta strand protein
VGVGVDFPSPSADRTITVDSGSSGFTVGSINFTTDSTFNTTIDRGLTGSKLILDNNGGGAQIVVGGTGTGTVAFAQALPVTLNDDVTVTINNTSVSAAVGALTISGNWSGSKGFTKSGDGLMTFTAAAKSYTGPTVVNGGRLRMSFSGRPTGTSTFTVSAGGQLDVTVGAGNVYNFGTGPLNLNGVGPTSGPLTNAPGAFRPDASLVLSVSNAVVLQSDAMIHIEGATGATTLTNTVSGPGKLTLGAPSSSATQGALILNGANTYQGGTLIAAGSISVSGAAATLGTGDVEVNNATSTSSTAWLSIASGVNNAISDTATLRLAGGGTGGVADQNYISLGSGVSEQVGALVLGGILQTGLTTYGATGSGANVINDEYFAGSGIIATPEPGSIALLAFAASALLGRRTKRSVH